MGHGLHPHPPRWIHRERRRWPWSRPGLQPQGRQLGQQPHRAPQAVPGSVSPGPGTWAGTLEARRPVGSFPGTTARGTSTTQTEPTPPSAWKLWAPRGLGEEWGWGSFSCGRSSGPCWVPSTCRAGALAVQGSKWGRHSLCHPEARGSGGEISLPSRVVQGFLDDRCPQSIEVSI